jgi:hypothetical protein
MSSSMLVLISAVTVKPFLLLSSPAWRAGIRAGL